MLFKPKFHYFCEKTNLRNIWVSASKLWKPIAQLHPPLYQISAYATDPNSEHIHLVEIPIKNCLQIITNQKLPAYYCWMFFQLYSIACTSLLGEEVELDFEHKSALVHLKSTHVHFQRARVHLW